MNDEKEKSRKNDTETFSDKVKQKSFAMPTEVNVKFSC